MLRRVLEEAGHEVVTASTGVEGLRLACEEEWDLITLDLVLPDLSGHSVLTALLERAPQQRIIVVSCIADLESRLQCLESGAVDFLVKPFAVRELRARVQSRLEGPAPRATENVLERGGLRLDLVRRRVDVGEHSVELPPREFRLLEYLMRRAGQVCTREELITAVWGYGYDVTSNVVEVAVARLRARLGKEDIIETVRSVGYLVPGI